MEKRSETKLLGMYLMAAGSVLVHVYVSCDKEDEEKNLLNCSVPAVSNLHCSVSVSSS